MTILKKAILPLIFTFLSITLTCAQTTTDPAPYCTGTYALDGCSSNDYIRSFTFGTLSNLNTTCTPSPHYIRYLPSGNLTGVFARGIAYSLTLTGELSRLNGFAVWIDYNQNQSFNDSGEMVYSTQSIGGGGLTYLTGVTIPLSAALGSTRLRVRSRTNNIVPFQSSEACATKPDRGEIEDYQITIGMPPSSPILGPLPTVTSISPTTANIGTSVTVLGNNFSTNPTDNIVSFGTKRAVVTSASATSLTASVPLGVTGSQLSVLRNGLASSSSQSFKNSFPYSSTINNTTSFDTSILFSSGNDLEFLEPVDFDNDGRLDVIGVGVDGSAIFIWRNLANQSSFSNGTAFALPLMITSSRAQHVKVADIDGDGKQDFIITDHGYNDLTTVFYNNIPTGATTFTSQMFIQAPPIVIGDEPWSSELADFDGDGRLDVAIANYNNSTVTVFRNTGWPGHSQFGPAQNFSVNGYPLLVKAADIDNDNKPELAVLCQGLNVVNVLKNTSSVSGISFSAAVNFGLLPHSKSLDVDDIDNDGRKDIVVACGSTSSGNISIFRNAGLSGVVTTSSFNTRFDVPVAMSSYASSFIEHVRLAEINGDGKLDMVLISSGSSVIYIWQNNSTPGIINASSFGPSQNVSVPYIPTAIACADFDNDGRNDLITSGKFTGLSGLKNKISIFSIGNLADNTYATGSLVSVPFTITLPITSGNIFTAQLSDSSGSFNSPVNIGSLSGTGSGVISATIPTSTIPGLNYRIRVVSLLPSYSSDTVSNSTSRSFRVVIPPLITDINPRVAPPGATVILTGSNFSSIPSENTVYFGGVRATVLSASLNSLVVNVPLTAQAAPLSVTKLGFTGVSSIIFTPSFLGTTGLSSTNFSAAISVNNSTIAQAGQIELVDFDRDGWNDAIVPNYFVSADPRNNVFRNTSSDVINVGSFFKQSSTITSGIPFQTLGVDIDGDGRKDIVTVSSSTAVLSIQRNVTVGSGITFETLRVFTTASACAGVASGDLDGDGKLDLVITNFNTNNISVFKNLAILGETFNAGTLATRADFAAGNSPVGIAIQDLDGDNKPDVIIANGNPTNTLTILKNTSGAGSISFAIPITISTALNPRGLALSDLNNDGKSDILLANQSSGNISIFENVSVLGAITFGTRIDLVVGSNPANIATGDINGDGKLDIAVTNLNSNTVSVIANNYTSGSLLSSSFATPISLATASQQPNGIAITDINSDLRPDIMVSFSGTSQILMIGNNSPHFSINSISGQFCAGNALNINYNAGLSFTPGNIFTAQLSDSSGSFSLPVSIGSSQSTSSGTIAATIPANASYGTGYRIRVVSSTPTFVSNNNQFNLTILRCPLITNISPLTARVGDTLTVNGNNFGATPADNIVYLGASRAIVLTANTSQLKVRVPKGATASAVSLTVGNFSAVGNQTFAPTYSGNTALSAASFSSRTEVLTGVTSVRSIGLVDLNQDNKLDLLAASSTSTSLNVYRNTSSIGVINSASFTTQVNITTQNQPWGQVSADFDNDGKLDLAVVNSGSNSVSVYRNTSVGNALTFSSRLDFPTGTSPRAIAAGDLDGDGKLDIGVVNQGSNNISILRNTTTSNTLSFNIPIGFTVTFQPSSLVITDLDGDFKADIAVASSGSSQISVFRNTASLGTITSGSFSGRVDFAAASGPSIIESGDIDGDGKMDLIVPNFSANSFSVFRNISPVGSITFATRSDFSASAGTNSLALGDIDGDAKLDVVTANNQAGSISIFRNTAGVGSVGFATAITMAVQSSPVRVLVADIDGDDRPDIAVSNSGSNSVSVFRNINKAPEPTIQASNITFTQISEGVYRVTCNKGNGARRIFISRIFAPVANNPVDENEYLGTPSYPFGSQIGTGGVAYVGSDSSVVVTLLLSLGGSPIDYHFSVYEFNGIESSSNYLITNPLAGFVSVPVVLVSFDATYIGDDKVSLKWVTSSEVNNKGFYVQRSIDNENWLDVTFVAGKINSKNISTYNSADDVSKLTHNNVIYYRLKQVDLDAKETILPTRAVQFKADKYVDVEWSVWPNPADNEVYIKANNAEQFTYELYNTTGNLVIKSSVLAAEAKLDLSNTELGIYYLKLTTATGTSYHKVVKH